MIRPPGDSLATARLWLEPLRVAHADEMVDVLSAAGLYRFTGGEPPGTDELRARYTAQATGGPPDGSQEWRNWIVREGEGGPAVGYVQATITPRNDAEEASAEVDDEGERTWRRTLDPRLPTPAVRRRRVGWLNVAVGFAAAGFAAFEAIMVRAGELPGGPDQLFGDGALGVAGVVMVAAGLRARRLPRRWRDGVVRRAGCPAPPARARGVQPAGATGARARG